MYRVIVRIETVKNFIEYGKPLLILLDQPANPGRVCFCSATGHGEGDYNVLLKQSRSATDEEIKNALKAYGYDGVKDLKIVKKRNKKSCMEKDLKELEEKLRWLYFNNRNLTKKQYYTIDEALECLKRLKETVSKGNKNV